MSTPLEDELAEGKRLASELGQHMRRMGGAAATSWTVVADDETYVVTIEHRPIARRRRSAPSPDISAP